jgi:hypothetical protein
MSKVKRLRNRADIGEREQTRRMMQRWVMELAWQMQDEHCMTRSGALQQAYLVRDLQEGMGRGIVEFAYMKQDGTERVARGTLCRGVSEAFDRYEYKHLYDDLKEAGVGGTNYVYWDLDRQGFRAFRAERLKSIISMVVK